jgi:23S rRNA pseudouridine1911/1915/1917 synthase
MNLKVLYEDNHLIAVFKPAGVLTQGDITGDRCLMDEVSLYLKERYKKPGNVFLGLLHRLDRPVSGIVLFAKTSKGASRLSEQFRNRTIEKIYHALVLGKPKENKGTLVNFLKKNERENTKRAELFYEVIFSGNKYSLLKIKPQTGRFHQIRAQLSSAGYPVLGDIKYGAPFALPDKSICLCATSISFKLATQETIKEISIPIPEWSMKNFSSPPSSAKGGLGDWQKYLRVIE